VYEKLGNSAGMGGMLGEVAGGMLGKIDALPLTYENYYLFSLTKFRGDTLSIGLGNQVWPTDWEQR
jgi:hypothetical protein